jgi:hypothetical protein
MRLNGWQRIGIVASVIWAIGGGFWGNHIGLEPGEVVARVNRDCWMSTFKNPDDTTTNDVRRASCELDFYRDFPEAIKYHWYVAAGVALIPIPLGWLAAWGLVGLVRWIRRGFDLKRKMN